MIKFFLTVSGWTLISRVAGLLNCSTRTIHRHMCDDLKREKQILNEKL